MVKQATGVPDKFKVDASLTNNPRKPKGKKTHELAQDRQEGDCGALD
ncbi:MAG: hypothetical protein OXH57_00060 [Ekhidna sp.]|nr:hypothetical protein [Ekhidna sp.]